MRKSIRDIQILKKDMVKKVVGGYAGTVPSWYSFFAKIVNQLNQNGQGQNGNGQGQNGDGQGCGGVVVA